MVWNQYLSGIIFLPTWKLPVTSSAAKSFSRYWMFKVFISFIFERYFCILGIEFQADRFVFCVCIFWNVAPTIHSPVFLFHKKSGHPVTALQKVLLFPSLKREDVPFFNT